MRLASAKLTDFKRFSTLRICNLPPSARLVVLLGPNGSGKSSFFDALQSYLKLMRFVGLSDELWGYLDRLSSLPDREAISNYDRELEKKVKLSFHGSGPKSQEDYKKSIYVRTAYRHEASFRNTTIATPDNILNDNRIRRLIDDDKTVEANYHRIIWRLLQQVTTPNLTTNEIMEETIGELKGAMKRVSRDLTLDSMVTPEESGSFAFSKGKVQHFLYENLSGGEKAAFDLLLDLVVKRKVYDNSLYCIDEPEGHLNTRIQGRILEELYRLVPNNSQMWIATHSIGMVRKAEEMRVSNPDEVVFLDFGFRADGKRRKFDGTETIEPASPDHAFWSRHYDIALADLGKLVAPERVVLCEGRSAGYDEAFDDACYNKIFFGEFPQTRFVSVGSASDVEKRMSALVPLLEQIVKATAIVRLRDRDDLTDKQIVEANKNGVRVLRAFRNIESMLLSDDIIIKLCEKHGQSAKFVGIMQKRDEALAKSIQEGRPSDDLKPTAQTVHQAARTALRINRAGSTSEAFMRDFLAPLVTPDTEAYLMLKKDIFDS